MTVHQLVRLLNLQPHPEGGYYREIYRSERSIHQTCLPDSFQGHRSFSTSIYYLLQKGNFSAFHRIKSDEIWHYHLGGQVLIHVLDLKGNYQCKILGNNITEGAAFQVIIPAGTWFAAEPAPGNDFTLAGCTVAPGFDFADFELANKKELLQQYPNYQDLISRLCR
jgi:predicted cupin superfamily sugar epimerase